jgi:NAD-dependent DNA ligase
MKQRPRHYRWPDPTDKTYEYYVESNKLLHKWKREYYLGTSSVSDLVYDLCEGELQEIEDIHPEWVLEDSVLKQVGYKIDETNSK